MSDETIDVFKAALRLPELLVLIHEYSAHQSWRCVYRSRYPWEPDCPCGLTAALREAELPLEWADCPDVEADEPKRENQ